MLSWSWANWNYGIQYCSFITLNYIRFLARFQHIVFVCIRHKYTNLIERITADGAKKCGDRSKVRFSTHRTCMLYVDSDVQIPFNPRNCNFWSDLHEIDKTSYVLVTNDWRYQALLPYIMAITLQLYWAIRCVGSQIIFYLHTFHSIKQDQEWLFILRFSRSISNRLKCAFKALEIFSTKNSFEI